MKASINTTSVKFTAAEKRMVAAALALKARSADFHSSRMQAKCFASIAGDECRKKATNN